MKGQLIDISTIPKHLNRVREKRMNYRVHLSNSTSWDEQLDPIYNLLCGHEQGAYDLAVVLLTAALGEKGFDNWELKLTGNPPFHYIFIDHKQEEGNDNEQTGHTDSDRSDQEDLD